MGDSSGAARESWASGSVLGAPCGVTGKDTTCETSD